MRLWWSLGLAKEFLGYFEYCAWDSRGDWQRLWWRFMDNGIESVAETALNTVGITLFLTVMETELETVL